MQNDALALSLRVVFTGLFLVTLVAGLFLKKNGQKLFGVNPDMPDENGSARLYTKTLIYLVWAHAALITGSIAFSL